MFSEFYPICFIFPTVGISRNTHRDREMGRLRCYNYPQISSNIFRNIQYFDIHYNSNLTNYKCLYNITCYFICTDSADVNDFYFVFNFWSDIRLQVAGLPTDLFQQYDLEHFYLPFFVLHC